MRSVGDFLIGVVNSLRYLPISLHPPLNPLINFRKSVFLLGRGNILNRGLNLFVHIFECAEYVIRCPLGLLCFGIGIAQKILGLVKGTA